MQITWRDFEHGAGVAAAARKAVAVGSSEKWRSELVPSTERTQGLRLVEGESEGLPAKRLAERSLSCIFHFDTFACRTCVQHSTAKANGADGRYTTKRRCCKGSSVVGCVILCACSRVFLLLVGIGAVH